MGGRHLRLSRPPAGCGEWGEGDYLSPDRATGWGWQHALTTAGSIGIDPPLLERCPLALDRALKCGSAGAGGATFGPARGVTTLSSRESPPLRGSYAIAAGCSEATAERRWDGRRA